MILRGKVIAFVRAQAVAELLRAQGAATCRARPCGDRHGGGHGVLCIQKHPGQVSQVVVAIVIITLVLNVRKVHRRGKAERGDEGRADQGPDNNRKRVRGHHGSAAAHGGVGVAIRARAPVRPARDRQSVVGEARPVIDARRCAPHALGLPRMWPAASSGPCAERRLEVDGAASQAEPAAHRRAELSREKLALQVEGERWLCRVEDDRSQGPGNEEGELAAAHHGRPHDGHLPAAAARGHRRQGLGQDAGHAQDEHAQGERPEAHHGAYRNRKGHRGAEEATHQPVADAPRLRVPQGDHPRRPAEAEAREERTEHVRARKLGEHGVHREGGEHQSEGGVVRGPEREQVVAHDEVGLHGVVAVVPSDHVGRIRVCVCGCDRRRLVHGLRHGRGRIALGLRRQAQALGEQAREPGHEAREEADPRDRPLLPPRGLCPELRRGHGQCHRDRAQAAAEEERTGRVPGGRPHAHGLGEANVHERCEHDEGEGVVHKGRGDDDLPGAGLQRAGVAQQLESHADRRGCQRRPGCDAYGPRGETPLVDEPEDAHRCGDWEHGADHSDDGRAQADRSQLREVHVEPRLEDHEGHAGEAREVKHGRVRHKREHLGPEHYAHEDLADDWAQVDLFAEAPCELQRQQEADTSRQRPEVRPIAVSHPRDA
mmetsp:Transcript_23915/g.80302  ORF Transcript_23915/g.80302 Transcript_23915/m.80302 type:complete len:657 (-) Transcript_23915:12-1982(-)